MARRGDGFTLVELMIVITIMGTMAAMIAPGMGEFLADGRANSAAETLIRMTRHMQARTQQTGLAHMLVFRANNNDGGGLGVMRIYEGMNNHCRQTPWAQTISGKEDDGHAPIDVLDMSSSEFNPVASGRSATTDDRDRQVIAIRVSGAVGAPDGAAICYEPGGAVWEGIESTTLGAGFLFSKPLTKNPIVFTISRKVNSAVRGRERTVLLSTSGVARFKF